MARRLRFHTQGALYHVMLRGNDRQRIFFSNQDMSRLCLLIQEGVERFHHKIEAFCFMPNHIHLAIRVADISLSQIMHHLSFRYTRYINRYYKRVGHLFQGRFKSILVDDEQYQKELVRYIHLNPVRAGMCDNPLDYFWSSHRAYMDLDELVWLAKDRLLSKFRIDSENDLKFYESFILKGIGVESEIDFKTGFTKGVVGTHQFVEETLTVSNRKPKMIIDLPGLVRKVCELYNLSEKELCAPGKLAKQSQARALLALLVRESENISLEKLGSFLDRDASGLTKLATRLEFKSKHCVDEFNKLSQMRNWLSSDDE